MLHRYFPRLPAPAFCLWAPQLDDPSPRARASPFHRRQSTLQRLVHFLAESSLHRNSPLHELSTLKRPQENLAQRLRPTTSHRIDKMDQLNLQFRYLRLLQVGSLTSVKSTVMKTSLALCRFGMAMI